MLLLLAACALTSCIHDDRDSRDRGAMGWQENVPTIAAPAKPRCKNYPGSGAAKRCEEAQYLGQLFVRKLSTGDQVCLEGGFGDGDTPSAACTARAAVVDSSKNLVLLEVREAKPDSRWFNKIQNQFWFEEGALVDLYLADHGY
jgi:hypothetical protein